MKWNVLLLTFLFSVMGFVASATEDPGVDKKSPTDIGGGVVHATSKKPLKNVQVTAYNNAKKEKAAVTDVQGNYSFEDLKPGTYKLVFEKAGFKKVIRERVQIGLDENAQLNVEMPEEDDFQIMPSVFFE